MNYSVKTTTTGDSQLPFKSTTQFVLLAILPSLASLASTIAWALYSSNYGSDNSSLIEYDFDHVDTARRHLLAACELAEENAEPQKVIWDAIRWNSIINVSVGILCLLGYELYRRDPIILKYVYDRKRLSRPTKVPPPLMLSRSLWRGENDSKINCCRVLPALLEIIFLTLDTNYNRYSYAADDARKAREVAGYYSCCRTGCYHNNCCNTIRFPRTRLGINGGESDYVDEDGYSFYPGHPQERKNLFNSLLMSERTHSSGKSESTSSKGSTHVDVYSSYKQEWRKSVKDLFPEDNLAANGQGSSDSLSALPLVETLDDEILETVGSAAFDNLENGDESLSQSNQQTNVQDGELLSDAAMEDFNYPSRLLSLCLPPGFHNWNTAFHFLAELFFLDSLYKLYQRCKPAGLLMTDNQDIDIHASRPGKELSVGDRELVRCAGLDTYLMLRLAHFGFDVTFYPFIVACVAVLPIYWRNSTGGDFLSVTIISLPNSSWQLNLITFFTACLYVYILRRLWLEWDVFITLRHDYLAHGDQSFDQRPTYLRKFRNSIMVECIPSTSNDDISLTLMFETLFPGQIRHAEMLIDTTKLAGILEERRKLIGKYDDIDAQIKYEQWVHEVRADNTKREEVHEKLLTESGEPKEQNRCWSQPSLAFYADKIRMIDNEAENEYDVIVDSRNRSMSRPRYASNTEAISSTGQPNIPSDQGMTKEEDTVISSTGFVEFTSLVAKQSAVQCNLTGQSNYILTSNAPDPRDMLWKNINAERGTTERRHTLVQTLLVVGLFLWGAFVTYLQGKTKEAVERIGILPKGVMTGYLPTAIISLVLIYLPHLFSVLAVRVIRFKSVSMVDEFILLWNTCYRLANIFSTCYWRSAVL